MYWFGRKMRKSSMGDQGVIFVISLSTWTGTKRITTSLALKNLSRCYNGDVSLPKLPVILIWMVTNHRRGYPRGWDSPTPHTHSKQQHQMRARSKKIVGDVMEKQRINSCCRVSGCQRKFRTYCSCSPGRLLCAMCFGIHVAEEVVASWMAHRIQ
jgi:hypothetical protein